MPLRDPKELYADALKNHYALIACNVADMEMLQAVIGAAEAERSPAFVMVSMGARKYVKDFPQIHSGCQALSGGQLRAAGAAS